MSKIVRGAFDTYRVSSDVLSKGGVGSIHLTDDPGLVYKEYFDPAKAPHRADLDRLVAVGRDVLLTQGKKPGDTPESSVNWPVDVVADPAGGVRGVVLPIIPATLRDTDKDTVRTLDFLVMARAHPPAATARVALLIRMAELLDFVQSRGLVHGDINGKNLAWTVDPQLVMYLIDCDGMVPQTPAPQVGVQALGWADPRVLDRAVPAHDHLSDRYALALAMYRGLLLTPGKLDQKSQGRWAEPGRIPDDFPADLATLLHRGLVALDGERRPAPREWVDALMATYVPDGRFATSELAALDLAAGWTAHTPKDPVKPAGSPRFTPIPPIPVPRPQPPAPGPAGPPPVWQPQPPPPPAFPPPVAPPYRPAPAPQYQRQIVAAPRAGSPSTRSAPGPAGTSSASWRRCCCPGSR